MEPRGGVPAFNQRCGFKATEWRETVKRWRLLGGLLGMSVPGANTRQVAEALGYSFPSALCRAFAQVGLPSPAQIPHALRECL